MSNSIKIMKKSVCVFLMTVILGLFPGISDISFAKGDLDCNSTVDLKDAVIALQVATDMVPEGFNCHGDTDEDVDDGKIGIAEAVYALQRAAGLVLDKSISVAGQVIGSGGLSDVTVSAGGVSEKTDSNGFYRLWDIPVPDTGRLIVTFDKAGYATYQRSILVEAGNVYAVSAAMAVYVINERGIDQTVDQTLEAKDSTGFMKVKLELSANSLADAAAGEVKVSVAAGDPTTTEGRETFPGDYMAASTQGQNPDTPLESVAFTEITILDSQGKELSQLTKPAQVTLRLPDEFQTGGAKAGTYAGGSTIEWWSYDETTAAWIREDADPSTPERDDAAVVDIGGILYAKAKVTHFTWWNVDRPLTEHACICVIVTDKNGSPMPNVEVVAKGVTYNGTSQPALTDKSGRACVNVKRTTNSASPEKVEIVARSGDIEFEYNVTDAGEGNVGTATVYVWDTLGSTLDGSGQCMNLSNNIRIAFDGIVTGTITRMDSQNKPVPVPGFTIYSDMGFTAVTDANGVYEMEVPVNKDFLLFAPGLASQKVRVSDPPGSPVTVNFSLENRDPVINTLTRTPEGIVTPRTDVTFSAQASDPDSDPVTYLWRASSGSISSDPASSQIIWTAPGDSGTAYITLAVRDDKDGETREQRVVIWGKGDTGNFLSFTIKDSPLSNQPVSGVYAVLHAAADNKTVERFLKTDTNGIADFGDIGRNRASVSIAYYGQTAKTLNRFVRTYMDISVGNIVFYVNQFENGNDYDQGYCDPATATINVTYTGAPDGSYQQLKPVSGYGQNGVFSNVMVCPDSIQDDGKISLVAEAYTYETNNQTMSKYGFLTDQDINNNGTYPIDMNRDPMNITWNTVPPVPVQEILIVGNRKGVDYNWSQYLAANVMMGNTPFPNEFPVDFYWMSGSFGYGWEETRMTTQKKFDQMPQSVTLSLPSLNFDTLTYDSTTTTLNWSVSGTMEKDLISISIMSWLDNAQISWEALMKGDTNTWTVVDLPVEIKNDFAITGAERQMTVQASDLDVFTSFEDLWYSYIQGSNPEMLSNRIDSATRYVQSLPTGRAARTALPEEKNKHNNPLKSFKELLRY